MSQLELREVTKRFGEVIAVNRLSLQVEKGECFTFLGLRAAVRRLRFG